MNNLKSSAYLPVFTSQLISSQQDILHGFYTRNGGVSKDNFSSLNVSLNSTDEQKLVEENRDRIRVQLGFDVLHSVTQVHGNQIIDVKKDSKVRDERADGMVCVEPGVGIGILTADCVPLLLCDAKNKVVGAAHGGWRSASGGIVKSLVAHMLSRGADLINLVAAIGPAIQQRSYQVQEDFICENNLDNSLEGKLFLQREEENWYFDLPGYVKDKCLQEGVTLIENLGVDTYVDPDTFFSHRYSSHQNSGECGRQLSVIGIRDS